MIQDCSLDDLLPRKIFSLFLWKGWKFYDIWLVNPSIHLSAMVLSQRPWTWWTRTNLYQRLVRSEWLFETMGPEIEESREMIHLTNTKHKLHIAYRQCEECNISRNSGKSKFTKVQRYVTEKLEGSSINPFQIIYLILHHYIEA